MKNVNKRRKVMLVMDLVALAVAISAGIWNYVSSGDWKWLCWVMIVVFLVVRVWIVLDAYRRVKAEAETWRVLYQKEADMALDLAWQMETMRREDVE